MLTNFQGFLKDSRGPPSRARSPSCRRWCPSLRRRASYWHSYNNNNSNTCNRNYSIIIVISIVVIVAFSGQERLRVVLPGGVVLDACSGSGISSGKDVEIPLGHNIVEACKPSGSRKKWCFYSEPNLVIWSGLVAHADGPSSLSGRYKIIIIIIRRRRRNNNNNNNDNDK